MTIERNLNPDPMSVFTPSSEFDPIDSRLAETCGAWEYLELAVAPPRPSDEESGRLVA